MESETLSPTAMKFLEEQAEGPGVRKVTSEEMEAMKNGDFSSELGRDMLKRAGVFLD